MSVRDLPGLIEDERLRTDIHLLLARVVKTTQFVHDAPSRRPAAADLAIALEGRARRLDAQSRAMIHDALESIAAVLNRLDGHFRQSATTFDPGGYPHGALALLYALRQARSARNLLRERPEQQDVPHDSGGPGLH